MEEYMEPGLSGIFWVKMVTKKKVLGSTETHFMDMRVNESELKKKTLSKTTFIVPDVN